MTDMLAPGRAKPDDLAVNICEGVHLLDYAMVEKREGERTVGFGESPRDGRACTVQKLDPAHAARSYS
jgi:hypothetical protein